ncbi:MAG: alpha-ketoacid dehydrogenase subunit beta, partial [Ramlibacter sp.]|nr:alpha-ketoacid dehydrogenase subunit beta [Ramlibacter sp.]
MARLTLVEAIVQGLREELERDPSIFMMGQDIGPMGGPLQSFKGLWETYGGTGRMIDAPISEEAITAVCFGAAMAGKRPVFELMFSEFTPLGMALFGSEAGIAYKTDGVLKAPLVMRTKFGISPHRGHPEDFHSLFVHCPGVKVVMPSTPYDAKGLIKAAIRDDNPVVFFEHMSLLHGRKEEVPDDDYIVPLGKADVKRAGRDVTIIASGLMVSRSLAAAA